MRMTENGMYGKLRTLSIRQGCAGVLTCIHTGHGRTERGLLCVFFVEYCEKEYNQYPRCALCGCYLGGPGAGHLQSRNHFNRLILFLDPLRGGFFVREDYWQVVRHSTGAARINHVDLEIQLCVGEPPRFHRRLEEVLGAGAFVQWELPSLQMEDAKVPAHGTHTMDEDGAWT